MPGRPLGPARWTSEAGGPRSRARWLRATLKSSEDTQYGELIGEAGEATSDGNQRRRAPRRGRWASSEAKDIGELGFEKTNTCGGRESTAEQNLGNFPNYSDRPNGGRVDIYFPKRNMVRPGGPLAELWI